MSFDDKLAQVLSRVEELSARMASEELSADEFVKLSREYSELDPIAAVIRNLQELRDEFADLGEILNDPDSEAEMRQLAELEKIDLAEKIANAEREVLIALLPKMRMMNAMPSWKSVLALAVMKLHYLLPTYSGCTRDMRKHKVGSLSHYL
jgi:protein subunit release factor A